MQKEIPEYSKAFGRLHVSASGGTQPIDEHILKLLLNQDYKMRFPMSARPRAGQIVQGIADRVYGLYEFSPMRGKQEPMGAAEAIRHGFTDYMAYQPLTWDEGKDAEAYQVFKEHIGEMAAHAIKGIAEYFGDEPFEGEYLRKHYDDRLDVPVIMYLDYASETKQIDLKCSLPIRGPVKKDGTRSWRVPKPKEEPTELQVMQQAVYWKGTGLEPALLFVTSSGYNIATPENCAALSHDRLEEAYENIVRRWLVVQNLLRVANGNWKTLFSLVPPDFGQIATRHGPEILQIAKQAWRID
jgi:hypothetical protein